MFEVCLAGGRERTVKAESTVASRRIPMVAKKVRRGGSGRTNGRLELLTLFFAGVDARRVRPDFTLPLSFLLRRGRRFRTHGWLEIWTGVTTYSWRCSSTYTADVG